MIPGKTADRKGAENYSNRFWIDLAQINGGLT